MGNVFTIRDFISYYENFDQSKEYKRVLECECNVYMTEAYCEYVERYHSEYDYFTESLYVEDSMYDSYLEAKAQSKKAKKNLFSRVIEAISNALRRVARAIRRIFSKISKSRTEDVSIPAEMTSKVLTKKDLQSYCSEHKTTLAAVNSKFESVEKVESKTPVRLKYDSNVDDETRKSFDSMFTIAKDPKAKIIRKPSKAAGLVIAGVSVAGLGILARLKLCKKIIETAAPTPVNAETKPSSPQPAPPPSSQPAPQPVAQPQPTSKPSKKPEQPVKPSPSMNDERIQRAAYKMSRARAKLSHTGFASPSIFGKTMTTSNYHKLLEFIENERNESGNSYTPKQMIEINDLISDLSKKIDGLSRLEFESDLLIASGNLKAEDLVKRMNDENDYIRKNFNPEFRNDDRSVPASFNHTSLLLKIGKLLAGVTTDAAEDAAIIQLSNEMCMEQIEKNREKTKKYNLENNLHIHDPSEEDDPDFIKAKQTTERHRRK